MNRIHSQKKLSVFPLYILLSLLLPLLLLTLGYNLAWPLALDIGGRDARFLHQVTQDDYSHGFHAVEDFGGTTVRWTSGDATVALPRIPDGQAALLTLRLLNSRPEGQPDPQVTVRVDEQVVGVFTVPRATGGFTTYELLLPGSTRLDWASRVRLQVDPITLPNDPRPLGVVLDRVTLQPLNGAPILPPLWLALCSVALGGLGYALPRSLGARRGVALTVTLALAALIALGIALRPLEVLPFIQRFPALLGIALLALWAARLLTSAETQHRSDGARPWSVVGRPTFIVGSLLPLLFALAWWMGPLFQLVMTWDGAANVRPAPFTLWIGGALSGLVVASTAWWLVSGRHPSEQRHTTLSATHRFAHILFALFAIAALVHLAAMVQFAFTRSGPDFWILFRGARDWVRGGSLYNLEAVTTNHFGHVFKVPPFYGMLFTPFVFRDGLEILFYHRVLNVILLLAAALVWLRMWRIPLLSLMGAGVVILLNFRPFTDTLQYGQVDLALLLLLVLALWAMRAERDLWAGVLVALGTLFKIYPIILLAFFVLKGRWHGLLGFALGMLAFNGIAVAVMGWEMHRVYLFEVFPRISGTTAWVENQTISGFLARLVSPPTEAAIFHNRSLALLGTALSGLVSLCACVLMLRPAQSRSPLFALQYGVFLLLMVLVVPAAWMHYETLLFVPFGALLLHLREREIGLGRAVALALSFGLIAYGNQWSFYDGTVHGLLTVAGVSYKFYGMLLLGGVLVATLLEERAPFVIPQPLAGLWEAHRPWRRVTSE